MKSNLYKTKSKNFLALLMAFAMVFVTLNLSAQCINTTSYGSATAPTSGTASISTCQYLTEYSTIFSCDSGATYTSMISGPSAAPGYITITEVGYNGLIVAHGPAPLTWTANISATHFVHYTVDSLCTTATGCHVSSIMFGAPVLGCTNPLATNYDSLATIDDGSCVFAPGSPCQIGVGANSESFETAGTTTQGPWAEWSYDAINSTFPAAAGTTTGGWIRDNLGTGSLNTGPLNNAPSLDGDYYLYCETSGSGSGGKIANLVSSCVDLNNFTDAAFVFGYSMYGATMGTLNVDVSTDGGSNWTNLWTKTGDQGQPWQEGVVNLQNSYAGQIVQLRMSYTSGSSFTGDCAIDNLRFMESPNAGCMDPFAINYDSTATMDDGSCLYPGCLDPAAVNYCATCNLNDSLSCVYPVTNSLDFCDDFESASLSTYQWTTVAGSAAGVNVQLTAANAIDDTVSLEMTGANAITGWTGSPTTEAAAFANTSHVSAANILLDLSASNGPVNLSFDYKTESFYSYSLTTAPFGGSVYSSMRVKVNGVVVSDINGDSWHGSEDLTTLIYDLSSYAGQSLVTVTFESACRYGPGYSSGTFGDFVWIDNVCAFNVTPCSYYDVDASVDADVSCNGGSDGAVSANVVGMDTSLTYSNSYVWSGGTFVGAGALQTGLAAGTYLITVNDAVNGCTATSSVVVEEPSTPVQVAAVVVASSTPISNNGSVDITPSGGTPCYTGSPILITEYDPGAPDALEIQNVSNVPVDVTGWTVTISNSYTDINLANTIVQTLSGTWVPGQTQTWTDQSGNNYWGNNIFWNPGAYPSFTGWIMIKDASGTVMDVFVANWLAADIAASTVGLAGMWVGDGYDQSTIPSSGNSASRIAIGNSAASFVTAPTSLGVTNTGLSLPFASAGAYTFAWSTGDTTEDVSGLGMGPVGVTVTDCNGCTGAWNGFIIATTTSGCIDPTASNYDPSANADCASNPIVVGSNGDTSCCLYPGCIDSTASNYNPLANISDSSCIYPGCTNPTAINYNPQANLDDGSCQPCSGLIVLDNQTFSCYGANNGSVTVSALACATWNWLDNGSTIGNRQNMAPGTYTLVGMTCDSSCIDTLVVTITEQTAIAATMSIGNEYPAGSANGSINLAVSGGTPCVVSDSLITHNPSHSSNGSAGVHFNIINNSPSPLTITGFSQGSYSYSGANNINVYYMSAPYVVTPTGWTQVANAVPVTIPTGGSFASPVYSTLVPITPVVIPAGATYGFYVGGTSTVSYATATASGPAGSVVASNSLISVTSGVGGSFGTGTFNPRAPVLEVHYGDPTASAYTYSWSNGDTTQNISGLTAGQYCATVTDCNGCVATFCDTVIVAGTLGCTDSLAANYNPLANIDDGSCWYIVNGCTDSTAVNFNPLANTDDGSCCFVAGCTDPFATNYNASACYNDSTCTYPSANSHPFCEDFESGSTATNGWVLNQQTYASVAVFAGPTLNVNPAGTTIDPLAGTTSLLFDGGSSPTGWSGYANEAQVYANTTHVSAATILMDLSTAASSCEMSFSLSLHSGFSNPRYSNMRVKVDGVVIADVNGTTMHSANVTTTNGSPSWTYNNNPGGQTVTYNMSAYSGQSISVTFEYAGKYNTSYSSGLYGCPAVVDDICFYDLTPCSYYTIAASVDSDATCNGGSDGSATASANGGSGAYSYVWDNGATTASITGLSVGTHCVTISDDTLGCVDSVCVTISEPAAISLSASTVDPSSAGNDGSIDLSVSGGTPCQTGAITLAGNHLSPFTSSFTRGQWFQAQSSFTMTGLKSPSDNPASANAAKQSVAIIDFGSTQPTYTLTLGATGNIGVNHWGAFDVDTGWVDIPGGFPIVAGNYYVVIGGAHDSGSAIVYNSYATAPIVTLDGQPTQLNRAGIQGSITQFTSATQLDNNIWCYNVIGGSSIGRIHMRTGVLGSSQYNYSWSTGDTTEDLSSLAAGSYSVTVTDCAGCISSASYTLSGAPSVSGCTDSTALNYNPLATIDDGSCTFCSYGCTDSTALNYDPSATCDDGSCIAVVYGCTDPGACNYYPGANVDDGSCDYSCLGTCGGVTGVNLTDVIHDRATFNWDNMNSATCQVDQIRIRYREVGTNSWTNKTMGAPVGSGCNTANTSKLVLNLTPSTQYEYDFKIWYCNAATVNWHSGGTFTTADPCLNATNVVATPVNTTKTTFCWDAPASPWSFVRLKYRIDSAGTSFSNIGGFGVLSPILCKDKNGLTPGTDYRVMWRTWCNATGGPYRSPVWDGPVQWTQPSSIRLEGGESIANLDVYPNPSRDVFNVTFTSEDVQDLEVRVINIVGEVLYTDNLEQFVGEYTKSIDLATYTKGVYFLEITTNNGVVNKKLILQ